MAFGFLGGRVPKSAGDLSPAWAFPLPRRFVQASAGSPRGLVRGGLVACWDDTTLIAIDAGHGRVLETRKLEGPVAGLDADGHLLLDSPGGALRLSFPGLDAEPAVDDRRPEERRATDAPDHPEIEPFLVVGRRRFKARLETKSRVTRHHLEICDEGHPPREAEVASYTLRSDRLTLESRGGRDVFGWVGDADVPLASVFGAKTGPVVVLRKRSPEWHEHTVSGSADLVAHGHCRIEAILIPEGHEPLRSMELGVLEEKWAGLGRRGAAPPHLERGSALRVLGLAGSRAIAEIVDVAAPRSTPTAVPKRRTILALDLDGAC